MLARYGHCMSKRPTRTEVGRLGEQIAATFLVNRGYEIRMRNVRSQGGELDIVASRAGVWIAVEVKTTTDGVDPTEALDERKLDALARTLSTMKMPIQQLDVIAVRLTSNGADVRWLRDVG